MVIPFQRWPCIAIFGVLTLAGRAQDIEQPVPPEVPGPVLPEAENHQRMAWLGVAVRELHPVESEAFGLLSEHGLAIKALVEGGPAEKAGLRKNDVLTRFNDQILVVSKQLEVLVKSSSIDSVAVLTYRRLGEEMMAQATLDACPKIVPPLAESLMEDKITGRVVRITVGNGPSPTTIAMSTRSNQAYLVISGPQVDPFQGPVATEAEIPKEMRDQIKPVADLKGGQWVFKLRLLPPVVLKPPVALSPDEGPKNPAPELGSGTQDG
ncbi:MAG: hypothetical protein ACI8T1_001354 [Verrucomicrobiales bacterium]|jgi:hypothetical protein